MKLPQSYYEQEDVVFLARDLLGKILITNIGGEGITAGIITETEAYAGAHDRASHAFGNRRTPRTETLYQSGGIAYVYLCYGIHHLFNVVTNIRNVPHAILIRAIQPVDGIPIMMKRLNSVKEIMPKLNGPGKLSKALGITTLLNNIPLTGNTLWIENNPVRIPNQQIIASPRIGVGYAGEHALWPFRFELLQSGK